MDLGGMSEKDKILLLEKIRDQRVKIQATIQSIQDADPYWFFKPSTGDITDEGRAFLAKWLKPEDVPATLQGQLHVLKSPAQQIAMFGGNQAGKTWLNSFISHAKVTGEVPTHLQGIIPIEKLPTKWPVYGRVYAPSANVIEEVMVPKFQALMPKKYWHNQGWERTYNKQDKILRYYKDGVKFIGQIKFLSYEQEVSKTQGASIAFAHFDEEPPYEFYKEALPRFTTSGRVDIMFFMTPTMGITWIKDKIIDEQDGKRIACFQPASITNPHASIEVLEEIMKGLNSYEERKMRLLGEMISLSGLIYTGDCALRDELHMIAPFELSKADYLVYRGLDVHLSKPTACVEVAVDPYGVKYVVGCYYDQADTEKVKADLAARARDKNYRLGPTRYDQSLDYEIKALAGINVIQKLKTPPNPIPAMFSSEKYKGSIIAGVDSIKQDLKINPKTKKPNLFFFDTPEVRQLVKEIRTLERDKGTNEERTGVRDKILEGKKDLHSALRYCFQNHLTFLPAEETTPQEPESERYI